MEHFCHETNFRSFIRIVFTEFNNKIKDTTLPDSFIRSKDYSFPLEERIPAWCGLNAFLSIIFMHFFKVLKEPTFSIWAHDLVTIILIIIFHFYSNIYIFESNKIKVISIMSNSSSTIYLKFITNNLRLYFNHFKIISSSTLFSQVRIYCDCQVFIWSLLERNFRSCFVCELHSCSPSTALVA